MPTPSEPLSRGRLALALTALATLFAIVVTASRAHLFGDAGPAVSRSVTRTVLDALFYLGLVYAALMCLLIVWALWPRDELRAAPLPRRSLVRTMLMPLLFTAAIALFWSLRMRPGSQPLPLQLGQGGRLPSFGAAFGIDPSLSSGASGIDWLAAGIVLALTVSAGILVWRRMRPRPRVARERQEAISAALTEVVDDTLDELRSDADPRRAVIRAYARFEAVLAEYGAARNPAETPYEYLSRVLVEVRVGAAAAARLTDLFEMAKFSPHAVSEAMKADAIDALLQVRSQLGADPPPTAHAFA